MKEHEGRCEKCGSSNFCEEPRIIEYDDGSTETDYDTLKATCRDCGKDWIIVYV